MNEYNSEVDINMNLEFLDIDQLGQGHELNVVSEEEGLTLYRLKIHYQEPKVPDPITIKWRFPNINVKGAWKSSLDGVKRIFYDWELEHLQSRISVDAPAISVFGHDDLNICTFASSDAINKLEMNSMLREEDNMNYCHVTIFSERHQAITEYEIDIRIDRRPILFSESLQDVSKWWETYESMKLCSVPSIAKEPLYSTWYQYHQNLDTHVLLEECKTVADLGYKLIILDDGWQTMDTNRGYDYTGDWEPERIPQMKEFVNQVHQLGLKFGLWFSVPFCGKKSKAYEKFKGKFLTENHRWAPVFDPRYPEVREHLINIYTSAIKNWGIDGFKLDFIDDFTVYPETELTLADGRDYASVNEAVDRLMMDVMTHLKNINPHVFIEFRQQYIGPALRKFGNMFRAFDCPNDSNTNRVRIADVKLLIGQSAVHSDPLPWHFDEPVELAALQLTNVLFSVPQLSIEINKAPQDHFKMVQFYTKFWSENKEVLMDGRFTPRQPLMNYPLIEASKDGVHVAGIYDQVIFDLPTEFDTLHVVNSKHGNSVFIRIKETHTSRQRIFDCMGNLLSEECKTMEIGIHEIVVPMSGLITLEK